MAGIDTQWQADLADVSKLSKSNDKHRYFLCILDVFSKHAWMVPIKDKTGKTLVIAFKVSKGAKIRNRYNQVPHLTQDTNGKVTNSQ